MIGESRNFFSSNASIKASQNGQTLADNGMYIFLILKIAMAIAWSVQNFMILLSIPVILKRSQVLFLFNLWHVKIQLKKV